MIDKLGLTDDRLTGLVMLAGKRKICSMGYTIEKRHYANKCDAAVASAWCTVPPTTSVTSRTPRRRTDIRDGINAIEAKATSGKREVTDDEKTQLDTLFARTEIVDPSDQSDETSTQRCHWREEITA